MLCYQVLSLAVLASLPSHTLAAPAGEGLLKMFGIMAKGDALGEIGRTGLENPAAFRTANMYAQAGDGESIDALRKAFKDAENKNAKVPKYAETLQKQFKDGTPPKVNPNAKSVEDVVMKQATKEQQAAIESAIKTGRRAVFAIAGTVLAIVVVSGAAFVLENVNIIDSIVMRHKDLHVQELSAQELGQLVAVAKAQPQSYQGVVGYLQTQGLSPAEVQQFQDAYNASGDVNTASQVAGQQQKRSLLDLD